MDPKIDGYVNPIPQDKALDLQYTESVMGKGDRSLLNDRYRTNLGGLFEILKKSDNSFDHNIEEMVEKPEKREPTDVDQEAKIKRELLGNSLIFDGSEYGVDVWSYDPHFNEEGTYCAIHTTISRKDKKRVTKKDPLAAKIIEYFNEIEVTGKKVKAK